MSKPYEIGDTVYYIHFNDYNVSVKICKGTIKNINNRFWYEFDNESYRVNVNYIFKDFNSCKKQYNLMRSEQ